MKSRWMSKAAVVALGLSLGLSLSSCEKARDLISGKKTDAEIKEAEYPEQVYFGDTHLHTSNSSDAFGLGDR